MKSGRVLLVDDDVALCETLTVGLKHLGFHACWRSSAKEAIGLLSVEEYDVVLADLNMPEMDGIELCSRLSEQQPDLPTIIVTAFGDIDSAIAAIRAGAYDFVPKPFELETIALALERAVKHRQLNKEVRRLRRAVDEAQAFGNLVGESPCMRQVREVILRVAASDATVLLTGESGTGKELVARELHRASRRDPGPFVAINCAAMPEALLESELFGHAKGAFTDARQQHDGLFIQASGGTLFLDEVGDMPLALQPKLLRVLQERTVRPVGSTTEQPIDVRVVAATNRDLDDAVEQGSFRADLLYRLKVIEISVPPLRERMNDVLLLAQLFLERFGERMSKSVTGITAPAAEKLVAYSWPGNVRELQNCMERAVVFAQHDQITVEDLPDNIRQHKATRVILDTSDPSTLPTLQQVEKRYVERVLHACGGNKRRAARILGVDRKTLYRRMERYGLAVADGA
jgi:two-component system response regulator HydG